MKESEFFDWLVKSGRQENSAKSVVSRVRRIEDVYPDLDSRIEDNTIEALLNVFTYTKNDEAKRRVLLHKIEIDGNPYTGTQSLRNALTQYIEFRRAYKAGASEMCGFRTSDTESAAISTSSCDIYKIDEFRGWMNEYGNLKESSAGSYITYLRALGRYVTGLEYVYSSLREDNAALAFDILEKVDEKLSALLSSRSVSSEMKKDLNNWRSAVRKYVDFLQDEIEVIPDEEELEELSTAIPQTLETYCSGLEDMEDGDTIEYTLDELKKNFAFRLSTQNRMSNDKDIFYPISIIRKLFCYSQRNGKKTATPNSNYDWFKNWIDDCAGEIQVRLNGKSYPLSDIRALLLYPATENVYIRVPDVNGNLWVYTETADGKTEPLKATGIRNIHIEHTPLMAQVLTDNISLIPAIDTLSKEIKATAKTNRIDLKPANFGKISKILFADEKYVDSQLLPLIPALKEELELLRKKCTLTLMQASHNLRKK